MIKVSFSTRAIADFFFIRRGAYHIHFALATGVPQGTGAGLSPLPLYNWGSLI